MVWCARASALVRPPRHARARGCHVCMAPALRAGTSGARLCAPGRRLCGRRADVMRPYYAGASMLPVHALPPTHQQWSLDPPEAEDEDEMEAEDEDEGLEEWEREEGGE